MFSPDAIISRIFDRAADAFDKSSEASEKRAAQDGEIADLLRNQDIRENLSEGIDLVVVAFSDLLEAASDILSDSDKKEKVQPEEGPLNNFQAFDFLFSDQKGKSVEDQLFDLFKKSGLKFD